MRKVTEITADLSGCAADELSEGELFTLGGSLYVASDAEHDAEHDGGGYHCTRIGYIDADGSLEFFVASVPETIPDGATVQRIDLSAKYG